MDTKTSFEPLVNNDAEILILGSIPGDRSIERQQYYGHPQNRFWRLIAMITHSEAPTDYASKKTMLQRHKIALWDVAQSANRKGSLDSAIRNEEPNDIANFIESHKSIRIIAFNGKKAEQLYNKYFRCKEGICYLSLPSTSPANATINFNALCETWSVILQN